MEAIWRRGYRSGRVTEVTQKVTDSGLSENSVIDEDIREALNFLEGRQTGRSNRFTKTGHMLFFVGDKKIS